MLAFNSEEAPFFSQCKMSLVARNGRADCSPSCLLLEGYLPRQPMTAEAVDDPTRYIVTPITALRKSTTSSVRARRYIVVLITKNLVESVCPKMG
jgi:hypothetical protein